MSKSVPDLDGYLFEDASAILAGAGYRVQVVDTGNHSPYRSRVLRQRQLNESAIELIRGFEHYLDPGVAEKAG